MSKLSIPFYEKERGTQFFLKAEYVEAIRCYSKAILGCQYLAKDGVLTEYEKYNLEVQIPCNLNIALCYMKLKEWGTAL